MTHKLDWRLLRGRNERECQFGKYLLDNLDISSPPLVPNHCSLTDEMCIPLWDGGIGRRYDLDGLRSLVADALNRENVEGLKASSMQSDYTSFTGS